MILNKTIIIILGITLIASAEETPEGNNTHQAKEYKHNNVSLLSTKNKPNHWNSKHHTKLTTSNNENNISNGSEARRYYGTFTRPDISDVSFQSLLNEYRVLVATTMSDDKYDRQEVVRLQRGHNENFGGMNQDNQTRIVNAFQLLTPIDHGVSQSLNIQKSSISALLTGRVPKWFSVKRDGATEPVVVVDKPPPAAAIITPRFTLPPSTTRRRRRKTSPYRISMLEDCDYNAYYCLKAFDTGPVCGRTMLVTFQTFKNYCLLDFVNCIERFEAWLPAYMGECIFLDRLSQYKSYHYKAGAGFSGRPAPAGGGRRTRVRGRQRPNAMFGNARRWVL